MDIHKLERVHSIIIMRLKTEKGERSSQGIEPATFHLLTASYSSALFFSEALVQWLSGGMNAQGPSSFLSWDLGWTRPTPGAPFAQRAPSHGLDFSIALPMPALWWHFNINFRASCWFRLVYTIIIKYVHFFQHLLFRAEFCGRRHLGRHLEADVLGSNYHRRSTGEAALNGMCWPLTMSTVLRAAASALQLQHPIILQCPL